MMNIYTVDDFTDEFLAQFDSDKLDLPGELEFVNTCKRGTINLACAQTGVGKSWFLSQFATCVSEQHSVLYISLENDMETDVSRFVKFREIYPNCNPSAIWYVGEQVWKCKEWLDNKELLQAFDFVCVDGLEYCVDVGTDKSFDEYKRMLKDLQQKFPKSCIWLSWQLARQTNTDKPRCEDIAYSYAAARLAYNIVAIYKLPKSNNRVLSAIKSRGLNKEINAQMVWGSRFVKIKESQVNNMLDWVNKH